MDILLTGKQGQLGWELQRTLDRLGPIRAFDARELDLRDLSHLREVIRDLKPRVVVNAAAYTAVDRAEEEMETALAVNAAAPGVLAEETRRLGASLVHFSTDYVFDGEKGGLYQESDTPNPLSVYGRSKLAGEEAIRAAGSAYLIFRTSWVYSLRRECFVTKVLSWARKHETLRIVDDQTGNPTWCRALAETVAQLLDRTGDDPVRWIEERRGVYHLASADSASRYEWARAILELDPRREEQVVRQVLPASSRDFPTSARRPANSSLDCGRFDATFGISLPEWKKTLSLAMQSPEY
jgi:dTDP-4-dehydrorhamnose reductase